MNYRHGFHAGNFADVFKHAVLARILEHLCAKPAAFRVIDTHAGAGLYDLRADEAIRGGEWHQGIGLARAAPLGGAAGTLLAPYLTCIAALNPGNDLAFYPGSPLVARAWLRPQDRLVACELEPAAASRLAHHFRGDEQVAVLAQDGWIALNAGVPPKERRGVVLIDPPFEQPDEFGRIMRTLQSAHRKWPTGIYLIWYPIKDRASANGFARELGRSGIAKILRAEIALPGEPASDRLRACGVMTVNPPWMLADELAVLLPALAAVLGGVAARSQVDWLSLEK